MARDLPDVPDVSGAAERAQRSPWLDHAVRAGLVAYGVVHLLVAWLAVQLALGEKEDAASNSGALHYLARQPLGELLVWLVALGMLLLVVWRLLEAGWGSSGLSGWDRRKEQAGSLGKAVVYAALAWSAARTALGDGSRGGTDSTTARVMGLPGGQWLVGAAGLAVVGYGVALVVRGWTGSFREHLDAQGQAGPDGSAYVLAGTVGYVAKGVAIGLVGGLFCYAALTHQARRSGGLDQALQRVLQVPFGQGLLVLIGVGIAGYGVFCFARAAHLSR